MSADHNPTELSTAAALVAALREGTVSSEQAVRAALERCDALQSLNAMITLRPDQAIAAARAHDNARAAGKSRGLLGGLPIVVKDNIAVEGCLFTGGSPAFRTHVADRDAGVVARLRAAGAIVVGKTNLHEIAFGVTSNNTYFGAVRNPCDHSRVAGGSSGGTAATVAAGIVSIGVGTDTGGSGRIPAAFCGCVGYRPTTGRYPNDGVMLLTTTRDTVSLMARSVEDIALADEAITGDRPPGSPARGKPCRLGVLTPFADTLLLPAVQVAFAEALDLLQRAGFELVKVDGAELQRLDEESGLPLVMAETYPLWRDFVARTLGIDFSTFVARLGSPDVRAIFQSLVLESGRVPDELYRQIKTVTLPRLRAAYRELFNSSGVSAFTFPTVVTTAPAIGEETILIGGERLPTFQTAIRNVAPGSLAGVPGMTLPIPGAGGVLPVGLALDARAGADQELFAIAACVERALLQMPV
jgi:indoleacetamide hydrolase